MNVFVRNILKQTLWVTRLLLPTNIFVEKKMKNYSKFGQIYWTHILEILWNLFSKNNLQRTKIIKVKMTYFFLT